MWKFALKNIFRKKVVTILSVFGIGFGLMLMFVLGAFNSGVNAQVQEDFYDALGVVEVTESEQIGGNSQIPINFPEKILDSTVGDDLLGFNVELELPSTFTAPYRANNSLRNAQDTLKLIGLNMSLDSAWGGPTTKVRSPGRIFQQNSYEIIVDSRIADGGDEFGFNLKVGDNLRFFLEYPNTDTGFVEFIITGFYEQSDNGAPSFVPREYYMYIDIGVAWEIQNQGWTELYPFFRYYTSVDLKFPATSTEETSFFIDEIKNIDDLGVSVDIFSLAEFEQGIGETLEVFQTFTTIISIITALAGGMSIIVAQLNSVSQRIKEFAILKATGWKNSHIFNIIVKESLSMGIMGAIAGIGLGAGLITLFSSGIGPFGNAQAQVSFNLLGSILAFALAVGVIGGLYPGIKASRVRPVKVLKGG